jgi:hypothetical protein
MEHDAARRINLLLEIQQVHNFRYPYIIAATIVVVAMNLEYSDRETFQRH